MQQQAAAAGYHPTGYSFRDTIIWVAPLLAVIPFAMFAAMGPTRRSAQRQQSWTSVSGIHRAGGHCRDRDPGDPLHTSAAHCRPRLHGPVCRRGFRREDHTHICTLRAGVSRYAVQFTGRDHSHCTRFHSPRTWFHEHVLCERPPDHDGDGSRAVYPDPLRASVASLPHAGNGRCVVRRRVGSCSRRLCVQAVVWRHFARRLIDSERCDHRRDVFGQCFLSVSRPLIYKGAPVSRFRIGRVPLITVVGGLGFILVGIGVSPGPH